MSKTVGVGVGILIVRDGKVLLGRRHENQKKADTKLTGAGTWTMPGGSLEHGESFIEAAARELEEETGMALKEGEVFCVNNDVDENAHFVTVGILAKEVTGSPEVREPNTITTWEWFGMDDLPDPMYFPSAHAIENYQKGLFHIPRNQQ